MLQTARRLPGYNTLSPSRANPFKLSLDRLISGLDPDDRKWLSDEELLKLEADPTAWVRFFWPDRFKRDFAAYQIDFYDWIRNMKPDTTYQPRIECEPRGIGKSSNGRAAAVYLLAKKVKFYVLYVSATQSQAKKHVAAIRKLLENEKLLVHYPHLRPQTSVHRNMISNWSADRLVTDGGQVIEFVSVLGNARGFNTEEGRRLDLILLDDVDDQKDSVDTTEKKLDIIGSNILGAGDETTDVLFLQNLIHRTSICTRLRDNTAGILVNRHFVGPFPLCKNFQFTEQDLKGDATGAKYYAITDFQPYDPSTSREYAEQLLNRLGPKRFTRECQQNLNIVDDDKDFREYSEIHHIITYSEFLEYYRAFNVPVWNESRQHPQIPSQWNVGLGQDWGTTTEHPASICPVARPNKNVSLNDCFFIFGEVVLPEFPHDVNKSAALVSPKRVAQAEKNHLKRWNVSESQIKKRRMSHEASAALNAFALDLEPDLKIYYGKWKAAKGNGVPQMQNVLEIDYTKEHSFRKYPKGHAKAGQPIKGMPKLLILVPDIQGDLKCDAAGQLFVSQPFDADGCARLRAEIPVYSHRNTGKSKIFDDMVDGARGILGELVVVSQGLTSDEQYTQHLKTTAPELLPEAILKIEDDETQSLTLAREQYERQEFDKKQKNRHVVKDGGFSDYMAEESSTWEEL